MVMFLIDANLCTGCGQCVDACPLNAITLQDAKAVINQSLCRQCGICADQCPVQAIAESKPAYVTQPDQREPFPQQHPGLLPQMVDLAGRLLMKGFRWMGAGSGKGRGGSGGHFGRGGFRGGR